MKVGKVILAEVIAVLAGIGAVCVGRKGKTALSARVQKDGANNFCEWVRMTIAKKKSH